MNPQEGLQYLSSRLRRLKNRILVNNLATGLAILLSAASALLLLGWLFNLVFWLTPTFRSAFVIIAAAWLAFLLVAFILIKFFKQPNEQSVALRVEKSYPQLKNRLIASLQLEENLLQNREGFSTEMIQAVIGQSQSVCRDLDFNSTVDRKPLRRWSKYLLSSVVLVVLAAVLFPGSFNESIYLYSHPRLEVERELTYEMQVSPEGGEVAKFAELNIGAMVFGTGLPSEAAIYWRYPGGSVKKVDLEPESGRRKYAANLGDKLSSVDTVRFTHTVREVRRSFEYWFAAGEIESPVYIIEVVDKPRVIGLKLSYDFPRYTGLAPLVVDENDGNITAIKGTQVNVEASLNKPVSSGWLQFADNDSKKLKLDGHKVSTALKVMENGSYHIVVEDSSGHRNVKPIEYRIESIADLYPEVDIISPGVPVDLDDRMQLDLGIRLYDDFGFSKINLIYRVYSPYGETFEEKLSVPFKRSQGRDFELDYPWDLNNIGLEPGGFVEYLIEAWDNDAVSGPKRGLSQTLTARLPSLDEMFAYLEDEGDQQISTLEKMREQQQRLTDEMEDLQEQLLTDQEMDWETRKDLGNSLKSQQDLLETMDQISENLKKMEDQMRKNDLTSLEILQKIQELQKLFDEVATPEMKEAMRKLQEALKQMDPDELRKAAEEMQLSQEELKERLDRQIALLKLMQIQQKMEAMTRMLEQLLAQQQEVNQETDQSKASELPKVAPKEQKNKEQFDELSKQADELKDMLKEMKLDSNPAASGFCEAPKQSDAGEQMQDMKENLDQSEKEKSQQSGKKAEQSLKELLEKMNEEKDSFNQSMGEQSMEQMKQAFEDLMYVSDQQEDVFNSSERTSPASPQLSELAAEQQALERTLEGLCQNMKEMAKQSPFISQGMNKLMDQAKQCMGNSTSNLTNRNGSAAMRNQKDAMFSLNQAANHLLQSMQNQKQCNSGSCNNQNMFKKMSQMAKKQQKINSKSQSMCDNPNQSGDGSSMMRRLAGEQGAVQKSLEELQKEQGGRRDLLGRLDEMAKDAQKVVEDLESGVLDENTLERQNKIHSRMLDFQRSLERQDFSEERRAESGADLPRTSPPQLRQDDSAARESYQDRLQRYLNEKFPEEYEELVKEYFRAVNSRQAGE